MKINFVHMRCYNWGGRSIFDGPALAARGGLTIAWMFRTDDNGVEHVVWSYALCSKKDNYNKSIGRQVATGRLESGKTFTFENVYGTSYNLILDKLFSSLWLQNKGTEYEERVSDLLDDWHYAHSSNLVVPFSKVMGQQLVDPMTVALGHVPPDLPLFEW